MRKTNSIANAQELPCGARFFRCALQVNPFDYIVRHSKETVFNNESDYNVAIVEACQRIGIEVIAITDHQRCSTGRSLAEATSAEGIIVFIGAELETAAVQARNQLLKDIMRDYGYLEHMGMGVPRKIVKEMQKHNGTSPDLVEDEERFLLRLWNKKVSICQPHLHSI